MPAAFCQVPATCLDSLMQSAFWPSVRKVAFKGPKKHTQVHTAAKDRASMAVLLLVSSILKQCPCICATCHPEGVCAPLFSWCPMFEAGRRSLLKSLLALIELGFYEQFGTWAINHKTVWSNLFWVLPYLTKWSCKVILIIQEPSPQHLPTFYGVIKRKAIKAIATDRWESRAKGGVLSSRWYHDCYY